MHHRVFSPNSLTDRRKPARRLELGPRDERDDCCDTIGWNDDDFIFRIERDTAPMSAPNIRWENERAARAWRREGAVVTKLVETFQAGIAIGRGKTPDLIATNRLRTQWRQSGVEDLCRPGLLSGNITRGNRTFGHRKKRLAGFPVEHEKLPGLGPLKNRVDWPAPDVDGDKRGR